ncbi:hypothetical protein CSB20_09115 [bacterium DOLZORAL124_64_63]|nr:MAG: hypothetical protein CSB20_09115 [bacterium DOLZORAL124_64_63]
MGLLTMALVVLTLQPAQADDLEELLVQVGKSYAQGYSSPFIHAFGANQNAGTYQTARIPWAGLTFGFGLKMMATNVHEDDQTFSLNLENVDLGAYDAAWAGRTGDVVMSGPTIFGDTETDGTITGYYNGLPVFQTNAIAGLVDTKFVPLAAPEAYLGGIFGLKATVRFLPSMDLGDYGKTNFLGYGLQWSPNGIVPELPVDVMIGFFTQGLDVGSLVETNAKSYFLGVSKSFPMATVYGGLAKDKSDMTIKYIKESSDLDVMFSVDGAQKSHMTLGVSLDYLMGLNVEVNKGTLVTYSGGLMFGF